jgi:hypothetical protein
LVRENLEVRENFSTWKSQGYFQKPPGKVRENFFNILPKIDKDKQYAPSST